jgi:hypothetical protein
MCQNYTEQLNIKRTCFDQVSDRQGNRKKNGVGIY